MMNPHLQQELALLRQQRPQEHTTRESEQPVQTQRREAIRSAIGRMLIAAGQRLVPTPSTHDEQIVTPTPVS